MPFVGFSRDVAMLVLLATTDRTVHASVPACPTQNATTSLASVSVIQVPLSTRVKCVTITTGERGVNKIVAVEMAEGLLSVINSREAIAAIIGHASF